MLSTLPLFCLPIAYLIEKAGFPKGVVNVVTTNVHTPDVGKEMTENPIVRAVSFTGSSPVGKILMRQASGTLKRCSLELGGNAIFAGESRFLSRRVSLPDLFC